MFRGELNYMQMYSQHVLYDCKFTDFCPFNLNMRQYLIA